VDGDEEGGRVGEVARVAAVVEGEGRGEFLVEFEEGDAEVVRDGEVRGETGDIFGGPVEEAGEESGEVGDDWDGAVGVVGVGNGVADERAEAVLEGDERAFVDDDLSISEGLRGDDEAIWLEVADPCLVVAEGWVWWAGHGACDGRASQPVTGQR
jgi:hypothetical protein